MMTSAQIRQSFLDFFKSKQHTIVPSSSLMPDSPNLLFTNAGMNQFVPIFLGQVKCPYSPGRAADTQKCIRAGGKHNDLDDVGLDTYHHTFFEMLGNWSFGDYFKKEAIEWAWELVVNIWKFPPSRLYATVYNPDKSKNDPSEFDQDAWNFWAEKFRAVGLDPAVHIVNGNKKDNFWMMGDTGPCGPCSELHVDLTPAGDTRGSLVNKGDARCIEIWNLVFIQFNANPDGTFSPLPAKHVDTGMGFERVTSIIQGTKGFTDFAHAKISNYETDIFRPIFDALEKMSGKTYRSTLPGSSAGATSAERTDADSPVGGTSPGPSGSNRPEGATSAKGSATINPEGTTSPQQDASNSPAGGTSANRNASDSPEEVTSPDRSETYSLESGKTGQKSPTSSPEDPIAIDIAFRVIADHIRTLSFAIADGIQPGNTDRNYVLRRILRRAVRYGRTLGFHEPFFYKLVDVLAQTMGDVFPEIRARKQVVQETIRVEEEAFNKTLDRGLEILDDAISLTIQTWVIYSKSVYFALIKNTNRRASPPTREVVNEKVGKLGKSVEFTVQASNASEFEAAFGGLPMLPGHQAFELYDTYGFPLDLTELICRERGLLVGKEAFEEMMEAQRARARAAQKKEVIELSGDYPPTQFVGFDTLVTECKVLDFGQKIHMDRSSFEFAIVDRSPLYAEMGGQVGDQGWLTLSSSGKTFHVADTTKRGNTFYLKLQQTEKPTWLNVPSEGALLVVDRDRRRAIERHHTVTHLLHRALHEVVSKEASQKGSFVGPDKLTFDFNAQPLTPQQVADIEKLVNERVLENAGVSWTEVPYAEVKSRKDVMQFFGDKYGDTVRVVQIGGAANKLDGYSMELCGGTHTRATGEIGLFRIIGENAIAAGVRRIEAVAGLNAYDVANQQLQLIRSIAGKINSPVHELEKKIEALLAHQKELEKQLKSAAQREAAHTAKGLLTKVRPGAIPAIIEHLGATDGDTLQNITDALKGQFHGVIVLAGYTMEAGAKQNTFVGGAVSLVASVSPEFTAKIQAGKIIQTIAPIVGGKGGGKPDNARGGGKDASKLDEALAQAASLLS